MSYARGSSHRIEAIAVLLILLLCALVITSCSGKTTGPEDSNEPPAIWFVDVDPEGEQVPGVADLMWAGHDTDGHIVSFRYLVVPAIDLGDMPPGTYAETVLPSVDSSSWSYEEVEPDTENGSITVTIDGDPSDPVLNYTGYYVFLQAFDNLGSASNIDFCLLFCSDRPPDTWIGYPPWVHRLHFVEEAPMRWGGIDPDDENASLEFKWTVYGPYDEAVLNYIESEFRVSVFVTRYARVYRFGEGRTFYVYDTIAVHPDLIIDSNIILVDTISDDNAYGKVDLLLDLSDPGFVINPEYCKPIDSSFDGVDNWVIDTVDTLVDLYRNMPGIDTTSVHRFLFQVTCRDEAKVPDPTPAWTTFGVIEPKFERDVIVLDFSKMLGRTNATYIWETDTNWTGQQAPLIQDYWKNVLDTWATQAGIANFDFDIDEDYVMVDAIGRRVDLKRLLKYKVMILYNDDIIPSGITDGLVPSINLGSNIYIAIDAGVNAFLTMRAPLMGGQSVRPRLNQIPDSAFQFHFGVTGTAYSGWAYHAFDVNASSEFDRRDFMMRIEDFVGAVSTQDQSPWPGWTDLAVDTNQLHDRYKWTPMFPQWGYPFQWGGRDSVRFDTVPFPYYPLPDDLRALPEVNYITCAAGTETMYLYESYYGASHPLGTEYSFHGAPVAIRYDHGDFRTVYFCFTPPSIEDGPMQEVINDVLDWLCVRE